MYALIRSTKENGKTGVAVGMAPICSYSYGVPIPMCHFECAFLNVNSTGIDCSEEYNGTIFNVANPLDECIERDPVDYTQVIKVATIMLCVAGGLSFLAIVGTVYKIWKSTKEASTCLGRIIAKTTSVGITYIIQKRFLFILKWGIIF